MVMRIFCRNSGMEKMALSLFTGTSPAAVRPFASERAPRGASPAGRSMRSLRLLLGRPGLHLVAHRLLGRRDDVGGAAPGLDLLQGGLGEVVGPDGELLGHVAGAQDADA